MIKSRDVSSIFQMRDLMSPTVTREATPVTPGDLMACAEYGRSLIAISTLPLALHRLKRAEA